MLLADAVALDDDDARGGECARARFALLADAVALDDDLDDNARCMAARDVDGGPNAFNDGLAYSSVIYYNHQIKRKW